jgi:hypothetical protein
MILLCSVLLLAAATTQLDYREPVEVKTAASAYLEMLRANCTSDPQCAQKFQLKSADELQKAKIGEPWAAFTLTYKDFRETAFQDILKVVRFNYYACPIVVEGKFKGIVRVCEDPDEPAGTFTSCGSRGPTRVAEINTFNLTLAPPSDSLYVLCILTIQNNARYIVVKQGAEFFAIAASDQAAELIRVNVRHVSRQTMFPLTEVLYKASVGAKQRDRPPR